MGTVSRVAKAGGGTNFNSGQTIDPAEVNNDFNTVFNEINGLLDDGNIETATIPGAKSLRFTEISAPANPSANDLLLYSKDNSGRTRLYHRDSAGLEFPLGTVTLEAVDTTEATTTSTTDVVLRSVTVNIPSTDGYIVIAALRKTSGAADFASTYVSTNQSALFAMTSWASTVNQAETGCLIAIVGPAQFANYLRTGAMLLTTGANAGAIGWRPMQADNVVATITSISIHGLVNNALITMGVRGIYIYRLSGI
jgi:hypothetical protein